MNYPHVKQLSDAQFYRLTEVKRPTFDARLKLLKTEKREYKQRGDKKKNKLSLADTLLMTLEYLREYPTFLNINYGISESYAYKLVNQTEDTLIQSGCFSLPGKKVLAETDKAFEVVIVDATETPIRRPKKATSILLRKKKTHLKNPSWYLLLRISCQVIG